MIRSESNVDFYILHQIIEILKKFKNNYNKKFNVSKLAKYLKLSLSEIDEIIALVLQFQDLYETVFKNHRVKKAYYDHQIYLVTEKMVQCPKEVVLLNKEVKILNDLIYMFKFVKRGKGFHIKQNGTELLHSIEHMYLTHPYFFELGENNIIYPSKLGLQLGELFISYNKTNKEIKKITIGNHVFKVGKNG